MMTAKKNINKNYENNNSRRISLNRFFIIASFSLIIITTAIYFKSLNNQFTNWDDTRYITDNGSITTLHKGNILNSLKNTFSSYVAGNYHPVTMLIYSIEYNVFGLNPKPYHIVNLVLHLLNSLLVLYFIWLLTKQQWVAFITALLFAIHPMHVESVVWMSELKDLLYSFFYLFSLCLYLLYIQKETNIKYILIFILFVFGLLSKAMAVSLPITFFVIDYFMNRKITRQNIIEKIPFLVLSFVVGYVAIEAQKSLNAIGNIAHYNFFDQLLFSSFGFITYLWKLFIPVNLSSFYTYPLKQNGMYPIIYYLSPLIAIAILFLVYKSVRFGKNILFGFLFFIITIVLVLQILPVGESILAERYTYLPYIGLFFIIAEKINNLLENKNQKTFIISIIILCVIIFSYLSFQRSLIWKNSITLWDDAIKKSDQASMPFYCRGWEHYQRKEYDAALSDYNHAIELKNDFSEVYYSKGIVYAERGELEEAMNNYNLALKYNPEFIEAYINRGIIYEHQKKYSEAIRDYTSAIKINPSYVVAYSNRGIANYLTGKYEEAINDYTSVINLNPTDLNIYINRGISYDAIKKYQEAIQDFSFVIALNPNLPLAYYNRGWTYFELGRYDDAIRDYNFTLQLNPQFSNAYFNRARVYYIFKQFQLALNDVLKAKEMGYDVDPNFIEELGEQIKITNTKNE